MRYRATYLLVVVGLGIAAACSDSEEGAGGGGGGVGIDASAPRTDGSAVVDATAPLDDGGLDAADAAPTGDAGDAGDGGGCVAPTAGIIGWWTGDDTTTDRAGNHDMTVVGTVPYVTGMVGKAFDFTNGNYLTRDHVASLNLTSTFTIEAWVNVRATGGRILDHITAGTPNGYLLDTYPNNVRAYAGQPVVIGSTALEVDTWYHLAAVFDGSSIDGGPASGLGTLKVYRNGELDGTVTATAPAITNSNPLRIGADSTGSNNLNGMADEVTLYDRALSDAEIQAIYAAGAFGKCR